MIFSGPSLNPKLSAVSKEEQRSIFVKVCQTKSKDPDIQVCKRNILHLIYKIYKFV